MTVNEKVDEIKMLYRTMDQMDLETKEDVKSFVKKLTTLIYTYKMIGIVHDVYTEDIEIIRENRKRIQGVDALASDLMLLCASFPDLTVDIENVIVHGNKTDGYKVFRRMWYRGTHTGYSQYGGPTGKSLGDNCLGLSMFYIKNIEGKWKIHHEMDMRSAEWIDKTMK